VLTVWQGREPVCEWLMEGVNLKIWPIQPHYQAVVGGRTLASRACWPLAGTYCPSQALWIISATASGYVSYSPQQ